jgi:transmembrane sensor
VDVIGTRFRVEDEMRGGDEWVRVTVEHGIVLVRGDSVPGRVQRLVDGQTIEVGALHASGAAPPIAPEPSASAAVPSRPVHPKVDAGSAQVPLWRALAGSGDYARAYREIGAGGIASEASHASVDDLLALGDVARLSGHPQDAVAPLSGVIRDHSSDARAGVAAFTLGRLELDTLARPDQAAAAFARSIELGLPGSLAEDAYARLVEADARAGDRAGARAAAKEYARKFPQGSRSSTIDRWVTGE